MVLMIVSVASNRLDHDFIVWTSISLMVRCSHIGARRHLFQGSDLVPLTFIIALGIEAKRECLLVCHVTLLNYLSILFNPFFLRVYV